MVYNLKFCIIGCGYIGLQIIKHLQQYSFIKNKIVGFDISTSRIEYLNNNYKFNNVEYSNSEKMLIDANIYIIAVPTNTINKNVNMQPLYSVQKMLNKYAKPNDIIILESSVSVGTTKSLFHHLLKKNIYVCYSPHRISPGDYENMHIIPKIISGLNVKSLNVIKNIYSKLFKTVIPVSNTDTAELCKLYENCFRVINIAFVNEIADLALTKNIDFNEVSNASATKPFGFMSFYPSFGVGGSCLTNNPYYLMHNTIDAKNTLSTLYNSITKLEQRPYDKFNYIKNFNNILIFGIGYKKNVDSTYESPVNFIYTKLIKLNKSVKIFDKSIASNFEYFKQFDCIIINYLPKEFDESIIKKYKQMNLGTVLYY